ncbi:MAG: hypothetical protein Q8R37_04485 [Nanoarchaeota archaeon]|nr:hypothetical protein [Nanoarchaeota archaeon]
MKQYKNTPAELHTVISLFYDHNITYNLFKCEHIFDGENKNLDLLCKDNDDYKMAASLLEKEGFILYLGENVEKFKKMYVRFNNGILTAIHLHREVAWHGVKALGKKQIFDHAREIAPGIVVPSPEDSILIHTAHILFENFSIRKREAVLLPQYLQHKLDWNYITKSAADNYWEKGLQHILNRVKNNENVDRKKIMNNYILRLLQKPSDALYLWSKLMIVIFRKINLRKKGTVIALIGVNGTGKTTLATQITEKYQLLTRFMGVQQKYYYYGWKPFSPLAKLGAQLFHNKKIFNNVAERNNNIKDKSITLHLFQEALFIYNYGDYFLRYLFHIYPQLRRGNVVVTDRYFYDLYGQYPYAERSIMAKLLLKIFPSPDRTFILDAATETLLAREKVGEERKVKSREYLDGQRKRYQHLNIILKRSVIINTEEGIEKSVQSVINQSWPGFIQKLNR